MNKDTFGNLSPQKQQENGAIPLLTGTIVGKPGLKSASPLASSASSINRLERYGPLLDFVQEPLPVLTFELGFGKPGQILQAFFRNQQPMRSSGGGKIFFCVRGSL